MKSKDQHITPGLVSVIMTNYNTPEEYLRQAIDSILAQTYSNFEFIIVDDCSTDNSLSILESYEDKRIQILKNSKNIGLTKSLNKALAICKGEFIARMDSDDISAPDRFEKQIEYQKSHPNVIVCGTWTKLIGDWKSSHTNEYLRRTIPDRETFRICQLFSNNPNIVHPTAMFSRKLMLDNNVWYNEEYVYSQDYRMWIDCNNCAECAIIPEVLLNYRVHDKAISSSKKDIQEDCVYRIIQEQLDKIHLILDEKKKAYHIGLLTERKPYDKEIKSWIKEIISANKKYHQYNQKKLERLLWDKWAEICYFGLATQNGIKNKLFVLMSLPITEYPEILRIRKARKEGKSIHYD